MAKPLRSGLVPLVLLLAGLMGPGLMANETDIIQAGPSAKICDLAFLSLGSDTVLLNKELVQSYARQQWAQVDQSLDELSKLADIPSKIIEDLKRSGVHPYRVKIFRESHIGRNFTERMLQYTLPKPELSKLLYDPQYSKALASTIDFIGPEIFSEEWKPLIEKFHKYSQMLRYLKNDLAPWKTRPDHASLPMDKKEYQQYLDIQPFYPHKSFFESPAFLRVNTLAIDYLRWQKGQIPKKDLEPKDIPYPEHLGNFVFKLMQRVFFKPNMWDGSPYLKEAEDFTGLSSNEVIIASEWMESLASNPEWQQQLVSSFQTGGAPLFAAAYDFARQSPGTASQLLTLGVKGWAARARYRKALEAAPDYGIAEENRPTVNFIFPEVPLSGLTMTFSGEKLLTSSTTLEPVKSLELTATRSAKPAAAAMAPAPKTEPSLEAPVPQVKKSQVRLPEPYVSRHLPEDPEKPDSPPLTDTERAVTDLAREALERGRYAQSPDPWGRLPAQLSAAIAHARSLPQLRHADLALPLLEPVQEASESWQRLLTDLEAIETDGVRLLDQLEAHSRKEEERLKTLIEAYQLPANTGESPAKRANRERKLLSQKLRVSTLKQNLAGFSVLLNSLESQHAQITGALSAVGGVKALLIGGSPDPARERPHAELTELIDALEALQKAMGGAEPEASKPGK